MNSIRPWRLLTTSFASLLVWSQWACKDRATDNAHQSNPTEQRLSVAEKEAYQKMFGSIVVPHFPRLDAPEAPSPSLYVISDKQGKLAAIRRLSDESRSWEFEELDRTSLKLLTEADKSLSVIIAADKGLPRDRFFALLDEVFESSGQDTVWIQVWGVHPYALQIPIQREHAPADGPLMDCNNLQDIVDYLANLPTARED
ncbi:hypothetical protein [Haloferula sp. A504]|uniref:hypothetical protein n=1 Tax=Haloferula sp. A504 TaxID=3373601 RepID=UPI0031CB4D26|nr:hypothetical protein [Verrucomicrobiaceae bacterium E54]